MFSFQETRPITNATQIPPEVLENEKRVKAEIEATVAQYGPNYTLFRHPHTGELVSREELGMGIEEWRAQLASRNAT